METNIQDILIAEFKNDPLYRMVIDRRLEGYLFPDSLLEVDPKKTYSTIEVGSFIGRKDSTIRNYFKTELLDYIDPEKVGNTYRLDYINIFKIHMISLLFEKGGTNKSEIAYELGITSGVKVGKGDNVPSFVKRQNEDIENIKQYLAFMTNKLQVQNDLRLLETKRNQKEVELIKLENKIELLKKEHTQDDYFNAIAATVEELAEMETQNSKLIKELKEKKSIFNWFMKKDTEIETKLDFANPADRISKVLKDPNNTEERNTEINQISKELEIVKGEIKLLNEDINIKLNELNQESSNSLFDNSNTKIYIDSKNE